MYHEINRSVSGLQGCECFWVQEQVEEEDDDESLAAIDRGVRDADAGRVTAIEELEKVLPQWISKSSSPTKP
jgi:predicted transcriptional regulator